MPDLTQPNAPAIDDTIDSIDDVTSHAELELHGARAEDSILFRAQESSAFIDLAALAEDYFVDQISDGASAVSISAVSGAGDATPLLLPVCSPASARPQRHLVMALSIAAMIMGLATAALAYTVAAGSFADGPTLADATAPEVRDSPLAVPGPIDEPFASILPEPVELPVEPSISEPELVEVSVPEPVVAPEVTLPPRRKVARRAPTPRKKAPEKKVEAKRPCGDEIECLLASIDDSPPAPLVETKPAVELPNKLESFAISKAMRSAQSRASGCDDRFGGGNVKVKITVAGDGRVTDVRVVSAPNPQLGTCVADATRKQRFPATHTGATFQWLFPYR